MFNILIIALIGYKYYINLIETIDFKLIVY